MATAAMIPLLTPGRAQKSERATERVARVFGSLQTMLAQNSTEPSMRRATARAVWEVENLLRREYRDPKQLKAVITLICVELTEAQLALVMKSLLTYERMTDSKSGPKLPIVSALVVVLLEMRRFDTVFRLTPVIFETIALYANDLASTAAATTDQPLPSERVLVEAERFADSLYVRTEIMQQLLTGYNEGPTLATASLASLEAFTETVLNWIVRSGKSAASVLQANKAKSSDESGREPVDHQATSSTSYQRSAARNLLRAQFELVKLLFTMFASTATSAVIALMSQLIERYTKLALACRQVAGAIANVRKSCATDADERARIEEMVQSWPTAAELPKVRVRKSWLMKLQPMQLEMEAFAVQRRTLASLGSLWWEELAQTAVEVDSEFQGALTEDDGSGTEEDPSEPTLEQMMGDVDESDDETRAAILASLALESDGTSSSSSPAAAANNTKTDIDWALPEATQWPEGTFAVSNSDIINFGVITRSKSVVPSACASESKSSMTLTNVATPHILQGTTHQDPTQEPIRLSGRFVHGELLSGLGVYLPPIGAHVAIPGKRGDWVIGHVTEHSNGKIKVVPLSKGTDPDWYWPDEAFLVYAVDLADPKGFQELFAVTGGVGFDEISCRLLPLLQANAQNKEEVMASLLIVQGHTSVETILRKGTRVLVPQPGQNLVLGSLTGFSINPPSGTSRSLTVNCLVRAGNARSESEILTAPLAQVRLIDKPIAMGLSSPREALTLWTPPNANISKAFSLPVYTNGRMNGYSFPMGSSTIPSGFVTEGVELTLPGDKDASSCASNTHVMRGQVTWLGSVNPRAVEMVYSIPSTASLQESKQNGTTDSKQDALSPQVAGMISAEETASLAGSISDQSSRTVSFVGVQRAAAPASVSLSPNAVTMHEQPIYAPYFPVPGVSSPESSTVNVLELNPMEGGITFADPQPFTVELLFAAETLRCTCQRVIWAHGAIERPSSSSLNSSVKASPGYVVYLDASGHVCVSPPPPPETTLITKTKVGSNEQNEKTAASCSFSILRSARPISFTTSSGGKPQWHRVIFSCNAAGQLMLRLDDEMPIIQKGHIAFLPSQGGAPGAVSMGNGFFVGARLSTVPETRRLSITEPLGGFVAGVRLWAEHSIPPSSSSGKVTLPPRSCLVAHWSLLGPAKVPVEFATFLPGGVRRTYWTSGAVQPGRMLIGTSDCIAQDTLQLHSNDIGLLRPLHPPQPHLVAFEGYTRGEQPGISASQGLCNSWRCVEPPTELLDGSGTVFDSPHITSYITLAQGPSADDALSFTTYGQVSSTLRKATDPSAKTLFELAPTAERPHAAVTMVRPLVTPNPLTSYEFARALRPRTLSMSFSVPHPTWDVPTPAVTVCLVTHSTRSEVHRLAGIYHLPPPYEYTTVNDPSQLGKNHALLAIPSANQQLLEFQEEKHPAVLIGPDSRVAISYTCAIVPVTSPAPIDPAEEPQTTEYGIEIAMSIWSLYSAHGTVAYDQTMSRYAGHDSGSRAFWQNAELVAVRRSVLTETSFTEIEERIGSSIHFDVELMISPPVHAVATSCKASSLELDGSLEIVSAARLVCSGVAMPSSDAGEQTVLLETTVALQPVGGSPNESESFDPSFLDSAGGVDIDGELSWSVGLVATVPQVRDKLKTTLSNAIATRQSEGQYSIRLHSFELGERPASAEEEAKRDAEDYNLHPYETFGLAVLRIVASGFLLSLKSDSISSDDLTTMLKRVASARDVLSLGAVFAMWHQCIFIANPDEDSDGNAFITLPALPKANVATLPILAMWLYEVISAVPTSSLKPTYSSDNAKGCTSERFRALTVLETLQGLMVSVPATYIRQQTRGLQERLYDELASVLGFDSNALRKQSNQVALSARFTDSFVRTAVAELLEFATTSFYVEDDTDPTDPSSDRFVNRRVDIIERTESRFKSILNTAAESLQRNYCLMAAHLAAELSRHPDLPASFIPQTVDGPIYHNSAWCTTLGALTLRRFASEQPLGFTAASAFKYHAGHYGQGFLALSPLLGYVYRGATWIPTWMTSGSALPAGIDAYPDGTVLTDAVSVARNLILGSSSAGAADIAAPLRLQFVSLPYKNRKKESDSYPGERLAVVDMTADTGRGPLLGQDTSDFARSAWTGVRFPSQSNYFKSILYGVVGLLNLGNTCYQNSIFQALFSTHTFRNALLRKAPLRPPFPYLHPADVVDAGTMAALLGDNPSSSTSMELRNFVSAKDRKIADWLQHLFVCLLQGKRQATAATRLQDLFGEPYNQRQSQDAYLFCTMLLDRLSQGLYGTPLAQLVPFTFGLRLTTARECSVCGAVRATHESAHCLALNFPTTYGPITDILVVSGYTTELCAPEGYERMLGNLNEGRCADNTKDDEEIVPHAYLCVSREPQVGKLPITDVCILYGIKDTLPDTPPGYTLIPENLNPGNAYNKDGYSVYLAVQRDPHASPITELKVLVSAQNAKPSVPAGYTLVPGDLNRPTLALARRAWEKHYTKYLNEIAQARENYDNLVARASAVFSENPDEGAKLFDALPEEPVAVVKKPPVSVPTCPKQVHIAIRRGGLLRDVTLVEGDSLADAKLRCPPGFTIVPRNLNPRCSPLQEMLRNISVNAGDDASAGPQSDFAEDAPGDDEGEGADTELDPEDNNTPSLIMNTLPPMKRLLGYRHLYLAYTCGGNMTPITGLAFETLTDEEIFELQSEEARLDQLEQDTGRAQQALTMESDAKDQAFMEQSPVAWRPLLYSCVAGTYVRLRITRGDGPPIRAESLEVARAPENLSRAAQAYGSLATAPYLPYVGFDRAIGLALPFSPHALRATRDYVALRETNRYSAIARNQQSEQNRESVPFAADTSSQLNPIPHSTLRDADGASLIMERPSEPITILLQKWLWSLQTENAPGLGPFLMVPQAVARLPSLEAIPSSVPPRLANSPEALQYYLPHSSVAYWIEGTCRDGPLSAVLYYSPTGASLTELAPSQIDLALSQANEDRAAGLRGPGKWILEGIRRDKKDAKQGLPFTFTFTSDTTFAGHITSIRGNKTQVRGMAIDLISDPAAQPISTGDGSVVLSQNPPRIAGVWETDALELVTLNVTSPIGQPAAWVRFKGWWLDDLVRANGRTGGGQGGKNKKGNKKGRGPPDPRQAALLSKFGYGKSHVPGSTSAAAAAASAQPEELDEAQQQLLLSKIDLELETYLLGGPSTAEIEPFMLQAVLPPSGATLALLSEQAPSSANPLIAAALAAASEVATTVPSLPASAQNLVKSGNGWLHCILAQDDTTGAWRMMGRFGAPHIKCTGFFETVLRSPFREFGGGSTSTATRAVTTLVPSLHADSKSETKAERGGSAIGGRIDRSSIGYQLNTSALYRDGVAIFPPPPSRNDIDALIATLTRPEVLSGSNAVQCGRCSARAETIQRVGIPEAPKHLMLNIMRFDVDWRTGDMRKTMTYCDFDQELVLPLSTTPPSSARYALHAVVVHSGTGISNGHYFAFTRDSARAAEDPQGAPWRNNDDLKISDVTFKDIKTRIKSSTKETAQLLVYVKIPDLSETKEISAAAAGILPDTGLGAGPNVLHAAKPLHEFKESCSLDDLALSLLSSQSQPFSEVPDGCSLWTPTSEFAALASLREASGSLPKVPGARRDLTVESLTAVDPSLLPFAPPNADGTFPTSHRTDFSQHYKKVSERLPGATSCMLSAQAAWARMALNLYAPGSLLSSDADTSTPNELLAPTSGVGVCTRCGLPGANCEESKCYNILWHRET